MLSLSILVLLILLYHIISDFVWVENLTWYLDSIAGMTQSLITVICLLSFVCKLYYYIQNLVFIDDGKQHFWRVFIPMIVLAGFLVFKILLCRVHRPFSLFLLAACLVTAACFLESHFDEHSSNTPLYITAIPIMLIFVLLSVVQALEVFGQSDPNLNFFYNNNSIVKQAFSVCNLLVSLFFSVSFVIVTYCMENIENG